MFLLLSFIFCIGGITIHVHKLLSLPYNAPLARPRGSAPGGVAYSFGPGLMPWSKESTRLHPIAYLRGILFHAAILCAFIILVLGLSMPLQDISLVGRWIMLVVVALGFVLAAGGLLQRWSDLKLRYLSRPDDYLAVAVVAVFLALAGSLLLNPEVKNYFYLWTAIMFIYIPVSKITHFIFWFFTRYFWGQRYGYRGVVGGGAKVKGGCR
jgi:hypothetical protein